MQHSEGLDQLAAALAKAQAAVKGAKKDASNPFFKTTYADLASVWEACREALTSNGLSVVQLPGYFEGVATLETILLHNSGQWLSGDAGAPISRSDAQGVGSALTYLRRYALAAVASVSPEDDDGNAASEPKPGRRGTSTASSKGSAATPPSTEPAPTSPRITDADEFPTRDTPWPGPGPTHDKTVREWSLAHLRMADDGKVKIPEEWLAIVRLELRARAAKTVTSEPSGAA